METPHKVTKADHEMASAQVMRGLTLTRQRQGAGGSGGEIKKWEDGSGLFNKKRQKQILLLPPPAWAVSGLKPKKARGVPLGTCRDLSDLDLSDLSIT